MAILRDHGEARWWAGLETADPTGHGAHGRSWARLNQVAGLPRT